MSLHRRNPRAGFVRHASLQQGPNGRALCRRCGTEVEGRRRTFCSDECVRAWRLSSDVTFLRACVHERDHGICALCGRDCDSVAAKLERFKRDSWRGIKQYSRWLRVRGWLYRFGIRESSCWDADHIRPVCRGGGPEEQDTAEAILANLRTLCVCCHKRETRRLVRRSHGTGSGS